METNRPIRVRMTGETPASPRRILLFGASGTIGRATASALLARGYDTVCPLRAAAATPEASGSDARNRPGLDLRIGDVADPAWLEAEVFRDSAYDAVVSCLASRNGEPGDAWAVDYRAQMNILELAQKYGSPHFVLLSAICVQKPRLAFQHAKLAFEQALIESGLTYSIVRPTAYFKSLSGQVRRVQQGKPFLLFGDGGLTACKPISDADLAAYLVDCIEQPSRHDRILPIGGPGPAMTPRQQGEQLFRLLGREPRFRQLPVSLLEVIATLLGALGRLLPPLAAKAELARIGHYYATESMLLYDPVSGRYDAEATPETGQDRLADYHRQLIDGSEILERGEHAVFRDPK